VHTVWDFTAKRRRVKEIGAFWLDFFWPANPVPNLSGIGHGPHQTFRVSETRVEAFNKLSLSRYLGKQSSLKINALSDLKLLFAF
jgi:hypothetical protein